MFRASRWAGCCQDAVVEIASVYLGSVNLDPPLCTRTTELGNHGRQPAKLAREMLRIIKHLKLESAYACGAATRARS
jgi:hypothetical protein